VGVILALISGYLFLGERVRERYITGLEKAQVEVLNLSDTAKNKEKAIEKLKENYKNKFVIIFFYDGYDNSNKALNYIAVMKGALDILEPFKSLKDLIVFKTFTTNSQKCNTEGEPGKKLLVCDPKLINSFKNLGIDHFKLVILSPLEFFSAALPAKGSNSWITISTFLGTNTKEESKRLVGLQFAQSLGRSLGLASEFDSRSISSESASFKALTENPPNCAKDLSQAESWWGAYANIHNYVGYFKGCAENPDFIYPEEGTVMSKNPQKESYGRVSEDYLRAVLSCYYIDNHSPIFPAGETGTASASLKNCNTFKKTYPDFWEE
jgi:hypothetical protein